jgi:oligopeptide/dipeptide ABC transporter ATP-binding protein
LFAAPRHHYTAGLLRSVPSYGEGTPIGERTRLVEIKGMVPSLTELPKGCKFVDRCPAAETLCHAEEPPLIQLGPSWVRCHYPLDPPSAHGRSPTPASGQGGTPSSPGEPSVSAETPGRPGEAAR